MSFFLNEISVLNDDNRIVQPRTHIQKLVQYQIIEIKYRKTDTVLKQ